MQPVRDKWIEAIEKCQVFDYKVTRFVVCSLHFLPDDILVRGKRRIISQGKVPSIFSNDESLAHQKTSNCLLKQTNDNVHYGNGSNTFQPLQNPTAYQSFDEQVDCCSSNVNTLFGNKDMQLITKANYKKLMDQSIELIKSMELMSKMKSQLEEKSKLIKQLKSRIHQNAQSTSNRIEQKEKSNETPIKENITVMIIYFLV